MIDFEGSVDDLTEVSDAQLVRLAREGSDGASAELWYRHSAAGRRAAQRITSRFDADDLVQEAFTRILAAISRGDGPDGAFRPYLYTTIRNISMSWARNQVERDSVDVLAQVADPDAEFDTTTLERSVAAKAFGSLQPEVREMLWYTEVEGMSTRDAGRYLGLTPGAAATMAYRARDRLRTAWVQAHLSEDDVDPGCRWTVERLGAYARHTLARRDSRTLERHLTDCVRCTALAEELDDVAARLRGVLLPLILGPVAARAFLGTGTAAAAVPATGAETAASGGAAATAGTTAGAATASTMTAGGCVAG